MKILPPTCLFGALLLMLALHWFAPLGRVSEGLLRLLGLIPLGAGVALNLWADGALRQVRTTVRPDETPRTLVTHGAYAISRNPMYLGFVLILLGVAILLCTVTPFPAVPAFVASLDVSFIRHEERVLEETFREQWENYRRKVRRWI